MSIISLINVAEYYQGLPHQKEALLYLETHTPLPVLEEFSKIWRNDPVDITIEDVDWKDFSSPISKYFILGEATNWSKNRLPLSWDLVAKNNIITMAKELDIIRETWGKPIYVNSWFRPSADRGYPVDVNQQVGGSSKSQHRFGSAADIRPSYGEDGIKFENWLDKEMWNDKALGYGQKAGKGFTHLDLRQGHIRWNY